MKRFEFEEFPIGFCDCGENICSWDRMGREEMELYRQCGFNFVMTPRFDLDNELQCSKVTEMLRLGEEFGIKVLLNISKLCFWCYSGPDNFRNLLREAMERFASYSSAIGFFLGDEPSGEMMGKCQELYGIFCEEAPDKLPYLNLNPGQFRDGDDFARNGGCRMLSYDCYSQMNPEESGVENFYNNLNSYYKMAKAADIPLMSIVLGTGHFRYRVPSEDDLRWQLGACIACGSSALLWFTFHTPCHINYRGGAIDAFGEKTPTFGAMRRIHLQFKRDYADLINHTRLENAYWTGKAVPGLEKLPAEDEGPGIRLVKKVFSHNEIPLIISSLQGKGKYEGKEFVLIFNNTTDKADGISLIANPEIRHAWMCRGEKWMDWERNHPDAIFRRTEQSAEAFFWLAPGQFEVFCLE